ncbi:MAG: hypothetical protein A2Z11_04440 [Candidatus Woykebacteria bacterium RBG_16_43_9]|uniref:Cell division protein FtsL n=1 Tax=Candidatus Woykebacteria bacterium RBG_16_43_9 TaxID=1802596 RepID=A0A1G1WDA5_9BACT|nr:MAG: hypothetical protein A2Z11_04440 [Candidatus Woykebacteria bacterium RBG_16_43_9]
MKTFFRSLILVILLVTITAIGRSVYNQSSKFKEINRAESKVSQLEKENEKLKTTLGEENSNFFLEKQARDKLGYQKSGDVLYVVPEKEKASNEEKIAKISNWKEWINLLFR